MADDRYEKLSRTERPVFIFASGQRCGSTLLQRFLNSNQNFLIWGEHNGFLKQVTEDYRALLDWSFTKSEHRRIFFEDGYDNFVPNLTPAGEDLELAAIAHVWHLFGAPARRLGRTVWGFKEVRYDASVALHLQECFANARFIHLTRNITDCFISMKRWETTGQWENTWTQESLGNWVAINESFLEQGSHLNQLLTLRYEDMIAMGPVAFSRKLADFLGEVPNSFKTAVFSNKLDGVDRTVAAEHVELTAEETKLVTSERVSHVLQSYGYKT